MVGLLGAYFLLVVAGFLNLVVQYGYQGADTDAEQLALTEQLFDAALAELAVVARGSPCLLAGDFNVEPTKIPCLSKGISAGLWVDLDAAWSAAQGRHPAITCKRSWDSTGGSRRDFLVGCPLATAASFLVLYLLVGGCSLILPFLPCLIVVVGPAGLLRLFVILPSGLLLGFRLLIRVGVLSLLRFRGSGRFMMVGCGLCLVLIVMDDDVSSAWAVWSSAAETALADAYCFSGRSGS